MNNRYFFIRHGESLANVADLIISDPLLGVPAYGLTERGKSQVRQSTHASGLSSSTIIIASDFKRTRETARIVSNVLGCRQPHWNESLRERGFGVLEAQSSQHYSQVWALDQTNPYHTQFGVESAVALADRMKALIDHLEVSWAKADILLVSHGDPLRFLELSIRGQSLQDHLLVPILKPAEIRPLTL